MKGPTEQLKDSNYWAENAPKWAASLVCGDGEYWFQCIVGKGKAVSLKDGSRRTIDNTGSAHRWITVALRPARPEGKEWDGEMPIDAQYRAKLPDFTIVFYRKDGEGTWQIWGSHSRQWLFDGYANDAGKPPYKLESIRSQAERERDAAIDHAFSKLSELREARQVLGDLYDAGLLREGE